MIRKAFRMAIHDGSAVEYERRHRPIWPELERVLIEHGVSTYSIFLDERTNDLFGYVEIEDEARWAAIANTDVCRRWWRHMRDVMPAAGSSTTVAGTSKAQEPRNRRRHCDDSDRHVVHPCQTRRHSTHLSTSS